MADKKEPLLTFFYNKNNVTVKSIATEELSLYGLQFPTFSDYKQTSSLGFVVYHGNESNINEHISYDETAVLAFINSEDAISYESTGSLDGGKPFYKPNRVIVNRITGGKGKYTFLEGYVVINTFESGDRVCYVYSK